MRILQTALDYLGWSNDLEGERSDYLEDEYEDSELQTGAPERPEQGVIPLRQERAEFAGLAIVRADPKNMDQATMVADEIKRRKPVVVNLQQAPEAEAKRIRDFIGGVTYGLNGYMRRIADWVYVCSPFDMPVERLVLDGVRPGEQRYENTDRRPLQEL